MKNQSNIASSILLNPQTLKDVYESSKNDSAGSAQKELNKELDSFEKRLERLQNAGDRFWTAFVNSDVAKGVLDLATGFANMAASITEATGGVPIIMGLLTFVQSMKGEGWRNATAQKVFKRLSKVNSACVKSTR